MRFAVFQYPLNDTAAIGMGSENVDLASEGLDDELNMFSRNSFDGFLDDVVSVLILDTLEDVRLEFLNKFSLLIREDMFKSLITLAD